VRVCIRVSESVCKFVGVFNYIRDFSLSYYYTLINPLMHWIGLDYSILFSKKIKNKSAGIL